MIRISAGWSLERKLRFFPLVGVCSRFRHTHHLQHISRDHLHTAHGGGQSTHDGGDDVEGAYAEQQLLKEKRREKRRLLEEQKERRKSVNNKRNDKGAGEKVRRRKVLHWD